MDLPDVKAGMAILAEHIRRLNAAITQVRVRPGVGYLVKESNGGTSLVINPKLLGGGGAAGVVCQYFEVTDATEDNVLKVEVAQNLIAGRYPDGMGIEFPPFILEISQNCYIYAAISWDIATLTIGSDSTAITILASNDLLQNTANMQYILVATVIIEDDPEAITEIQNVCSEPIPNPCVLDWSS